MKYPLATSSWTEAEKEAAISVIESGNCTMGKLTKQLESDFAKKIGSKYAVFCNSGSSANLLAVAALFYTKEGALKRGDEVIVPAVSWATTYYPLHQYGLKLKFVDVNIDDFNISTKEIEKAVTHNTKAIFAVNLLGMPADLIKLKSLCKKYDLILLEDNCESLGGTINGKQLGTFGKIGTYSSFFSHHICTVEGGFCVTDDEELYHIMVSLRAHGWIRNLPDVNHVYNKSGNQFEDTFKFVLPGYNVRPNDIFSAIGIEQVKKLDNLIETRIDNYKYLEKKISKIKWLSLQSTTVKKSVSSWFGFGFITKRNNRMEIIKKLSDNEIESRPIVAGNFTKNPVIKWMDYAIIGTLPNSTNIDENGFFIGNNGVDIKHQIDHFVDVISKM